MDINTITQNLAEARTAYHKLNTGIMARVVVDQNGERVEFTATSKNNLYNYILELENKLNACGTTMRPSGPASFIF